MKRQFLIYLVLLAILLTGCSNAAVSSVASQTAAVTSEQNTAMASLGSITLTATGAGSLVPSHATDLSFNQGGTLVELSAKVGDEVEAGTVLARLQINLSAAELEEQCTAAEMAILQAQHELNTLKANAELESAQALIRLEVAQIALEDAEDTTPTLAAAQQAVADAKEAVQDAEMQLYISQSTASSEERYTAYAALLFKQKALADIEKQISRLENQIKSAKDKAQRDRLKHQMLELEVRRATQQLVVNQAQARLDAMDEPVDEEEVALAQAQLARAEAQLADAERQLEELVSGDQNGIPSGVLLIAQAELNDAQAAWDKLQNGPDSDALALAQAEQKTAQARLDQLNQSQLVLDLVTPIGGMILNINYAVGDRVEARQSVMTVGDMEHPSMEVFLDETDISLAQVGARVEVVFDALPNKIVSGMVTQVDPALTTSGNTKSGRLLAQLDDIRNLGSPWLPVGLNATVDVQGKEATSVVIIPIEALQETPDGSYEVYLVQEDGQVKLQPVTIGLMDATQVEIQAGLEPGQTVLLDDPGI